jgi:hypothetical protein
MLPASMLGDYPTSASTMSSCFSSSYRPVGKPVSHHVVTRPTFSSLLFLDHHTGHPARHDAWILLYECVLDAL